MTPAETIQRLAETANNIGFLAGVGGIETVGMIVSYLANHPEKVDQFFADGWIDTVGNDDPWATGCLTWHRKGDGEVVTPQDLRISRTVRDLAKPTK